MGGFGCGAFALYFSAFAAGYTYFCLYGAAFGFGGDANRGSFTFAAGHIEQAALLVGATAIGFGFKANGGGAAATLFAADPFFTARQSQFAASFVLAAAIGFRFRQKGGFALGAAGTGAFIVHGNRNGTTGRGAGYAYETAATTFALVAGFPQSGAGPGGHSNKKQAGKQCQCALTHFSIL